MTIKEALDKYGDYGPVLYSVPFAEYHAYKLDDGTCWVEGDNCGGLLDPKYQSSTDRMVVDWFEPTVVARLKPSEALKKYEAPIVVSFREDASDHDRPKYILYWITDTWSSYEGYETNSKVQFTEGTILGISHWDQAYVIDWFEQPSPLISISSCTCGSVEAHLRLHSSWCERNK